jgi:hypothetical protein
LTLSFGQESRTRDGRGSELRVNRLVTGAPALGVCGELKDSASASNLVHKDGVGLAAEQWLADLVIGKPVQQAWVTHRGRLATPDKKAPAGAFEAHNITGPLKGRGLSIPSKGSSQQGPPQPGLERHYVYPEDVSVVPGPSMPARDMHGSKAQLVQAYPGSHSSTSVFISDLSQAPPFQYRSNACDARSATAWIQPGSAAMQSKRPRTSNNGQDFSSGRKVRSEPARAHPIGLQALPQLRAQANSLRLTSDVVVVTPGSKTARLCNNSSTVRGYGQYHGFRPPDLGGLGASHL